MAEILSEFGHLVGLAGGNNIQATTMPTYSSVPLGTIVQYIGTTTADYINGYFYKATATGWEQHDTQPASNADNSITAFKESSPAQAAHAVDDYIRYNNVTYIVTAAIAIGDTLTIGTNIAVPTLDEGTVIYTPETGGGSAGGGHVIVNPSGTEMEQRASLQFVDANVTDDSTNDKTKIENIKVINSESELTNASDGMYMGSYDDEAEGVISADMVMYDSETTVEDELDNKVDKVTGKGLSTNDYDNIDKAKVGKIDETTTSISGNPISISGLKSTQLAKDPIITFEPIQAGSGDPSPSNIRAISGYDKIEVLSCGKNLLPLSINAIKAANNEITWNGNSCTVTEGSTLTLLGDNDKLNSIKVNGTVTSQKYIILCRPTYNNIGNILKTGVYYTCSDVSISDNITQGYDGTFTIRSDWHFDNAFVYFFINAGTYDNAIYYPQLEEGQTATEFESSNINEIKLTLGQTIYGGTLDVRTGVLTVTWKEIDLASQSWEQYAGMYYIYAPDGTPESTRETEIRAERYKPQYTNIDENTIYLNWQYNLFVKCASGETPQGKCIYKLNTPYTIQLTPHEISLLSGYSYVSTNGTSMQFSYKNGELASLEDVEAVGKTINLLGDNISQVIPLDASSTNKLATMNDIIPKCVMFMSLSLSESPKNTGISCNAGGLGRTIIVIGSGNSSAGNNTYSEIGMIRCGHDSNNVEYTSISVSGPNSIHVINSVTSDSDGNIIIAGNGFNSTLVLISNKEF